MSRFKFDNFEDSGKKSVFRIVLQLSVIIVNYNSGELLKNCLFSLRKATTGMQHEIIVIDNHSTDSSLQELESQFNEIRFVLNDKNTGFAKACNQGFALSGGEYVLFLNPDTVLTDNCLHDCIIFMQSHTDAGAIGVRMTDSRGRFLKESKRGFPSPAASFFKLSGFSALFPGSVFFGKYYATHLPEKENNKTDVLSGAFMFLRSEVFRKCGGFDDTFFMYGEDIDLSCRIREAGYNNYYLGTITIMHIKGGSTSRNNQTISYFYHAMHYFVKKHFTGKYPAIFLSLIHAGIWIRKKIAQAGLMFSSNSNNGNSENQS